MQATCLKHLIWIPNYADNITSDIFIRQTGFFSYGSYCFDYYFFQVDFFGISKSHLKFTNSKTGSKLMRIFFPFSYIMTIYITTCFSKILLDVSYINKLL